MFAAVLVDRGRPSPQAFPTNFTGLVVVDVRLIKSHNVAFLPFS